MASGRRREPFAPTSTVSATPAKRGRGPLCRLDPFASAVGLDAGHAGVIEALRRRAREGGSYRVHIYLAKVCMWVQDLGMFSREEVAAGPPIGHSAAQHELATADGPFGTTRYLPTQIRFSTLEPRLTRGAEPLDASPLHWW